MVNVVDIYMRLRVVTEFFIVDGTSPIEINVWEAYMVKMPYMLAQTLGKLLYKQWKGHGWQALQQLTRYSSNNGGQRQDWCTYLEWPPYRDKVTVRCNRDWKTYGYGVISNLATEKFAHWGCWKCSLFNTKRAEKICVQNFSCAVRKTEKLFCQE